MRPLADKRCTQFNLVPLQTDNYISGPTDSKSSQYQLKDAKVKLVSPLKKPAKVIGDGTRDLLLKKIVDSGESTAKALNIRNESPWCKFNKIYTCELAGEAIVAEERVLPSAIFTIRKFPRRDKEDIVRIFSTIQHENLTSSQRYFFDVDFLYVIFEHQPITLNNLVACMKWPSQIQLASIVGQVSFSGLRVGTANIYRYLTGFHT